MLYLQNSDYDVLRAHAALSYPLEACGVLLGTRSSGVILVEQAVPCRNAELLSPQTRYSIDPVELVRLQRHARELGLDIVGFYHSHPDHPPHWSSTDLAEAHWIGCVYVISEVRNGTPEETRAFLLAGARDEDKHFVPEEIALR